MVKTLYLLDPYKSSIYINVPNSMNSIKLIKFLISLIVVHITWILTILFFFNEEIIIETHMEKESILFFLAIAIGSIVLISYIIGKLFVKNILELLIRGFIGIFISLFSLNIYTFIKSIYSLITYNDILYKGRLFTIKYIYKKEELMQYINSYYVENSKI